MQKIRHTKCKLTKFGAHKNNITVLTEIVSRDWLLDLQKKVYSISVRLYFGWDSISDEWIFFHTDFISVRLYFPQVELIYFNSCKTVWNFIWHSTNSKSGLQWKWDSISIIKFPQKVDFISDETLFRFGTVFRLAL